MAPWRAAVAAVAALAAMPSWGAPEVRIKDIANVQGVRENQLLGVGLVTGLAGQGDSANSAVLQRTLSNLFSRFGIVVAPDDVNSKNTAVVMVNAEVPAFVRPGDRIDVTVSSLGDARALEGGVLLQTPLRAANGTVYAVAQGSLLTAGAGGGGGRTGVRTVGTLPGGAIVERPVLSDYVADGRISLVLRQPNFVTANAVAAAIREAQPELEVATRDASVIDVTVPADTADVVALIATLEQVTVTPDSSGRVVIDAKSGIVIVGEAVRIGRVAVTYRDAQVQVGSRFGGNDDSSFVIDDTTTVSDFVGTLQEIGLDADVVIGIMRAVNRAGALFGTLVII